MENKIEEKGIGLTPGTSIHNKVLELLPKDRDVQILDVGCGVGGLSEKLLEKGYKNIIALDIESKLRIKLPFIKADLNKDLILKETFDVIICQEVIEHLENPRHLLRELKKILREEGMIIITTPNILNWKARIYYILKGIIWGFNEENYKFNGHLTPVTGYDFQRICNEVNLKIFRMTYNNSSKEIFGENLIVGVKK